ncbi:MAG: 7TM diverse intracellular signaling domain-containing protein [Bacteroidales bacterium]
MYLKFIYILTILNFCFFSISKAQNDFTLSYKIVAENESINNIINDSTLKFTAYEIDKTYFKPDESYLIRIEFKTKVELKDLVLLLNTPIAKLECYGYDQNNNLNYKEAGIDTEFNKQDLKSGDKNKIYLNYRIKNNVVYLKLRNNLFFKYNIDKIEIKPVNEWIIQKEKQHLFQGIFIGIIFILIFISLLYKISLNYYINYYYIGYMFSNLVFFIFLNEYSIEYIFNSNSRLDLCLMVSMHFASLFFIQFARYFFDLQTQLPTVEFIAKTYFKISIIIIFCFLILSFFDFPLYSYIAVIIEICNQLMGLLIVAFAFRKTDLIGKLIIIGSIVSTIDILYMLYNNHIVELTTQNVKLYQAGYIVEILFILIAIRLRYHQVEKEQQKALIKNVVLESENQLREQQILLLKQENEITQLKSQLLQNEIHEKNKEIAINAMQITQKDLLLGNLHEKLKKLQPETAGSNKKEINEIVQNLNTQQKDTFWKEFEVYFEQMHNGFFSKLEEKCPSLKRSEKRLCAFLKVGMTSKEIASITQKNYKSIEVLRVRLRKKLAIEKGEILSDFLNNI